LSQGFKRLTEGTYKWVINIKNSGHMACFC
jgi:hypothetical protein